MSMGGEAGRGEGRWCARLADRVRARALASQRVHVTAHARLTDMHSARLISATSRGAITLPLTRFSIKSIV